MGEAALKPLFSRSDPVLSRQHVFLENNVVDGQGGVDNASLIVLRVGVHFCGLRKRETERTDECHMHVSSWVVLCYAGKGWKEEVNLQNRRSSERRR